MHSRVDPPTSAPAEAATPALPDPQLLPEAPFRILEVRASDGERPVTITAAIAADALQAICTALSEQLHRHAHSRTENAEDILTLREHTALVERLQPLAAGQGHAVVAFTDAELRTCVLELTRYVERVDDEHYQDPDLRARLEVIGLLTPALWEAIAAAAATIEDFAPTTAGEIKTDRVAWLATSQMRMRQLT
jgi:hypothetical protein